MSREWIELYRNGHQQYGSYPHELEALPAMEAALTKLEEIQQHLEQTPEAIVTRQDLLDVLLALKNYGESQTALLRMNNLTHMLDFHPAPPGVQIPKKIWPSPE